MADERVVKLARRLKQRPYGDGAGAELLDDTAVVNEINKKDKSGSSGTQIGMIIQVLAPKLGIIRKASRYEGEDPTLLAVAGISLTIMSLLNQKFSDEIDLSKTANKSLIAQLKTAGLIDNADLTALAGLAAISNVSDAKLDGYELIGLGTIRNARELIKQGIV